MSELQNQINNTSKGGILELQYGKEYVEKIIIKKPITIRSVPIPATIVESSPTVKIQSKNVILNDLNIVCNEKNGTCLWVKKNCKPSLENVNINGKVEGLTGEEGDWDIPDALQLSIVPDKINRKRIILQIPVAAKIYPLDIANVKCDPQELTPGINEIDIIVEEISKDTLVYGNIIIETLGYKLKRRIGLGGGSFEKEQGPAPVADECIWICESAQCTINLETLEFLPKGTQGEPYEFILDEKKLNCQDYDISIPNLPEGLKFNKDLLIHKIEGIPKPFGEFEFEFVFAKDGQEYRYPSKLNIDEKVIIPLKIAPVEDPVTWIQGEMIKINLEVLSSNSTNVSFKAIKELPKGLQLSEQTGELWGKIENHKKYTTTIEINDGTNTVRQKINLLVIPKDPLTLNIKKSYQVYQNEEFKIKLNIPDADQLSPKIKIKSEVQNRVTIISSKDQFFLKGKISKLGIWDITVYIMDVYERKEGKTIKIECVKKPSYTFKWISTSPIIKEGLQFRRFSEKIEAEVRDEKDEKIAEKVKYSAVGNFPKKYELTAEGWLNGIIDGNSHTMKIRAETGGWKSEKEFVIKTDVISSSKIVKSVPLQKGVFDYKNKKNNSIEKTNVKIKDALKKGYVQKPYHETILAVESNISPNFSLNLRNLPKGLTYNLNKYTIEGIPIEEGLFSIDVSNINTQETWQTRLEIIKSPIFHKKSANSEKSDEKKAKPDNKIKLGKAFQ